MKKTILLVTILILSVGTLAAKEQTFSEKIEKTWEIQNPSKDFLIVVDNVFGSVTVEGTKSKKMSAEIQKKIWARSEEQMKKAKEEVKLDIIKETQVIELYVDGPFRDKHDDMHGHSYNERRYKVNYDFVLKVPRDVSIEVRTVNGGQIQVEDVRGNFDIHNVNGGIKMSKIRGSGEAITVNGPVTCRFEKNPEADCEFKSINGDIKLYFANPLSSDISFDTLNGDMYSDFEVTTVTSSSLEKKKKNGKSMYKLKSPMRVRSGDGGPLIAAGGINGDLYVLKNK